MTKTIGRAHIRHLVHFGAPLLLALFLSNCGSKDGPDVVDVQVGPTAQFSAQANTQNPMSFTFTDESVPGDAAITAWNWTFGDGATSTAGSPMHVYDAPGNYGVSLTVTTSVGSSSTNQTVEAVELAFPPTASFTATADADNTLSVSFEDTSDPGTEPITDWSWDFGDGQSSTDENPVHLYAGAGSYDVTLTVTSTLGSDSQMSPVQVVVPPTAGFSFQANAANPLSISFTDESEPGSAEITEWSWEFGDGGSSTDQNPTHEYASEGMYEVTLTVTSSAGSDEQTSTVEARATPTAAFSYEQGSENPLAVTFTDLSSSGDEPITDWSWDFGDGNTSTEQSPIHEYVTDGTFSVTLTVTTTLGSDSDTQDVEIAFPPTADFSWSTVADEPLAIAFTDESDPGTAPITEWSWEFGDGNTSTERNPTHTYASAGEYEVRLRVTTAVDDRSRVQTVTFQQPVPPTADFSYAKDPNNPLGIVFTDRSTAGSHPIEYRWSFGQGGATSTASNPTHAYSSPGTMTVQLTVTSAAGSDTETKQVVVATPISPTASFRQDRQGGPNPVTVRFTNTSDAGSEPITRYRWDFGDGSTSDAVNPTHTFRTDSRNSTRPQFFNVTLTVWTAAGTHTGTVEAAVESYELMYVSGESRGFQGAAPSVTAPQAYSTGLVVDESTSGAREVDRRVLPYFYPLVDEFYLWRWDRDSGRNSCDNNAFMYPNRPTDAYIQLRQNSPIPGQSWDRVRSAWEGSAYDRNFITATLPSRLTLVAGGWPTGNGSYLRWEACDEYYVALDHRTQWITSTTIPVERVPEMRRSEFWQLKEQQFLDVANAYSNSYGLTYGVHETTSSSMSLSIGVSATVGGAGASSTLAVTLSQTFGEEITISNEKSQSSTFTAPPHMANYQLRFMVWQKYEVYEVVNPGTTDLWTSSYYQLHNREGQLRIYYPSSQYHAVSAWYRVPGS